MHGQEIMTTNSHLPAVVDFPKKKGTKNKASNEPRFSEATNKLKSYVDRVLKLEEEKKEISEMIKEVYLEAESQGYNKDALKLVVKQELKPADMVILGEANFYLESLGKLPLFAYAERDVH